MRGAGRFATAQLLLLQLKCKKEKSNYEWGGQPCRKRSVLPKGVRKGFLLTLVLSGKVYCLSVASFDFS